MKAKRCPFCGKKLKKVYWETEFFGYRHESGGILCVMDGFTVICDADRLKLWNKRSLRGLL